MLVNALDQAELGRRRVVAYVFGQFRLDPRRRMLFRGSHVIPMPERVFQLLLTLIEANGEVASRETIALRVWPDSAVSDANIAQHLYSLRRLLGEHAEDRAMIMTANRRGYRLAARVDVELAAEPTDDETSGNADAVKSFCDLGQASYLLERRTAPSLRRAIEIFEAGLRGDSDYVPALIGLARAYALLAEYSHVPPASAFAKAKEAIGRVLALTPASATARAVLSNLLLFADWRWTEAKTELELALRTNPNSSIVRNNAVYYYICAGEYDEALFEAKRAVILEPSSLSRQILLGVSLVHAGNYRQGIACLSTVIASDAAFCVARRYLAQALLLEGEPEAALTELLLLPSEPSEDCCFRLPLLARAYADCGERLRAEQIYSNLLFRAQTEYVASWNLALVAVALGRPDVAMGHLRSALESREPALLFLKSLPWFQQLAGSEPFKVLSRAVGP